MIRTRIFVVGVVVLVMGATLIATASARPLTKGPVVTGTPDLVARWMQRQTVATPDLIERYVARQSAVTSVAPDLIERYVARQPAASFYTPAALKAYGLRMQAMAQAYQENASISTTSNGFDVSDALIGAAGGLVVVLCAAGLFVAVSRSRHAQVAV